MKISIIVATYNNESTLRCLLDSIVHQKYKNIELIIIDGNSIDKTIEIIQEYIDSIEYFKSESDNGVYDALNKGIRQASGDYVYFIGADDILYSRDVIENVVDSIKAEKYPVVLCGDVWQVDVFSNYQKKQIASDDILNIYARKCMPHHQGMFVRTNVAKGLLFDEQYKIAADYDMFHKIINEYGEDSVKSLDYPVAYFSLGSGTSSQLERGMREYIEIMKKNKFSPEVIDAYIKNNNLEKYNMKLKIKKKIPMIIQGLIKKIQGWNKHHCEWRKCPWER